MQNVFEMVDKNKKKSNLVVLLFIVFIVLVTYGFALAFDYSLSIVGIALIFSGVVSFITYYNSDKIILSISGAREADRKKDFNFYTVAENLSMAAQIPMPRLYVIEDTAMNAFATGRDPEHAVVVATTGLLSRLDRSEIEGVVAHELSHVRNYDIRLMSIVTVLVGLITLLADMFLRMGRFGGRKKSSGSSGQAAVVMLVVGLVLALLSPLIARLIKLAISRRREFLADASAAKLTRFPDGLARALKKISKDTEPLEAANKATAHLYIENPLRNTHSAIGWFAGMFNTHPPVGERIAALTSHTVKKL